ncbi:hypothetical protein Taro_036496, partial [Colocasia esculenta]|nr:hypothetical protein [Colocasia esculenta]
LPQGRVEEFLAAGEAGDPHTKSFFFPVVSVATCTDHHLEVDERARRVSKGSNLAPMTASHRYTVNHGGRVEGFLAAGEAGDPHTKPFFFPVVSSATYTDHHLEVDQRRRRREEALGAVWKELRKLCFFEIIIIFFWL